MNKDINRINRNAKQLHHSIINHALKGLSIGLISLGMISGASYAFHNINANAKIINYIPRNKWISEAEYSDFGLNNDNYPSDAYFMKYRNFRHLSKNLYSLGKRDGRNYKKYSYAIDHDKESDNVDVNMSDSMPDLTHNSKSPLNFFYPSDVIESTMVKSKLNKSYIRGLMNNKYDKGDKKDIDDLYNDARKLIHKHHINKRTSKKKHIKHSKSNKRYITKRNRNRKNRHSKRHIKPNKSRRHIRK